jgi:hypothetical protein
LRRRGLAPAGEEKLRSLAKLAAAIGGLCLAFAVTAAPKELKGPAPPNASRHGSQTQAEQAARPDDLICTYETLLGSHVKRRICVTRSEKEAQARADQDAMGRMQRDRRARQTTNQDPATGL